MPESEAGGSESAIVDAAAGVAAVGSPGLLWGVGAVSAKLDIARPTLRTWDRRYGLGPSLRTAGGHRRYTDVDVSRVQLMSRLLDSGVAAAQAAQVACTATEEEMAAGGPATRSTRPADRRTPGSPKRSSGTVRTLIRAAADLQADELARAISMQLRRHGVVLAWDHVFAPFLIEIGHLWTQGAFGIESEHLASGVLASELRSLSAVHRSRRPSHARVVLSCAEDELHALPVMALEAALAERKIPCLVLGQRVPGEALRRTVLVRRPTVVFVWASVTPWATGDAPGDLESDRPLHVLLGGPGWDDSATRSHGRVVVERVRDLGSTVSRIERALQS